MKTGGSPLQFCVPIPSLFCLKEGWQKKKKKVGQTPRVLNYSPLNEIENHLIFKSTCFFKDKSQIEYESSQSQSFYCHFATHSPLGVDQSFWLCHMLCCLRFVCALVQTVVADVPIRCRAGLHGLRGTKITADGSMLPPSSRPRGTCWAAASLSLVMVSELERAWQDP